jgi:hypothetical protein
VSREKDDNLLKCIESFRDKLEQADKSETSTPSRIQAHAHETGNYKRENGQLVEKKKKEKGKVVEVQEDQQLNKYIRTLSEM